MKSARPRRRRHLVWFSGDALCGLRVPDRGQWGKPEICKNCTRIAEKRGLDWNPANYVISYQIRQNSSTWVPMSYSTSSATSTITFTSSGNSFTAGPALDVA